MGLCLVPWSSMDHTEGVGGLQRWEQLCNHGSQIQGRKGDKEKVRVATPVAGMSSAEVKGA